MNKVLTCVDGRPQCGKGSAVDAPCCRRRRRSSFSYVLQHRNEDPVRDADLVGADIDAPDDLKRNWIVAKQPGESACLIELLPIILCIAIAGGIAGVRTVCRKVGVGVAVTPSGCRDPLLGASTA